jgi:hypothetical protein
MWTVFGDESWLARRFLPFLLRMSHWALLIAHQPRQAFSRCPTYAE